MEGGPLFWLALHVDAGKGRWRRHELTELRRCGPIRAHTITCRGRVSLFNVRGVDRSRRKDEVVIYCWYQRSRASQSTKTIEKSQPRCTPRLLSYHNGRGLVLLPPKLPPPLLLLAAGILPPLTKLCTLYDDRLNDHRRRDLGDDYLRRGWQWVSVRGADQQEDVEQVTKCVLCGSNRSMLHGRLCCGNLICILADKVGRKCDPPTPDRNTIARLGEQKDEDNCLLCRIVELRTFYVAIGIGKKQRGNNAHVEEWRRVKDPWMRAEASLTRGPARSHPPDRRLQRALHVHMYVGIGPAEKRAESARV
jgi:hypothetical protein